MFGRDVNKWCSNCLAIRTIEISTEHRVNGERLYVGYTCPHCHQEIAKEDRAKLSEAVKNGDDISVGMF